MKRTRAVALLLVVATILSAAGAGSTVATAQSDDGVLEPIRTASDWIAGVIGWAEGTADGLVSEPADRDADDAANDLQEEYNGSSDEIEDWVNDRVDADTDADVLEIELEIDDDTETVYLVSTVNDSEYGDSSVVDSTDRSVDEDCTLEGDAARNAADELDTFVDRSVDEDRDVSSRYLGRLSGRYRGDVSCSFDLTP